MRSFKKPLKMEEERYYLKMYRNGDEKAKEKLLSIISGWLPRL